MVALRLVWDRDAAPADLTDVAGTREFVFAAAPDFASGELLEWLLASNRPSCVVDLRVSPRFDLERYSRRSAFRAFDAVAARYLSPDQSRERLPVLHEFAILLREVHVPGTHLVLADSVEDATMLQAAVSARDCGPDDTGAARSP